jgi:hypothetical protein
VNLSPTLPQLMPPGPAELQPKMGAELTSVTPSLRVVAVASG